MSYSPKSELLERSVREHLLRTMVGTRFVVLPFEILIGHNVFTMSKVDPVIHTEYLCSGGATTWIAIVCGASHQVFRHVLTSPDLLKLAFASC